MGRPFVWDDVVPSAISSVQLTALGQVIVNLGLVHKNGEVVEYWDALKTAMRRVGFRLFGWYVWDQGFGIPGDWGGHFAGSHEFLFHFNRQAVDLQKFVPCAAVGKNLSGTGLRTKDGSMAGRPKGVVQPFKIPDSVVRITKEMSRKSSWHPAPFPYSLPAFLMRAFPPGIVLDPFCGSGTTLLAAKEQGRRAIGIEIEESYCERIANRLSQDVLFTEQTNELEL
jgi:DNA modification methylase